MSLLETNDMLGSCLLSQLFAREDLTSIPITIKLWYGRGINVHTVLGVISVVSVMPSWREGNAPAQVMAGHPHGLIAQ